jgi:hypothetical protein
MSICKVRLVRLIDAQALATVLWFVRGAIF